MRLMELILKTIELQTKFVLWMPWPKALCQGLGKLFYYMGGPREWFSKSNIDFSMIKEGI
jgi:hypothetical protein